MYSSLVVILALAIGAIAEAPGGNYGPPAPPPSYGPPQYTPQVFKHVYVHTAPDEPEDSQSKVIRVPGGDKHVNIIFVKTPSQSSSSQTEVILPDQDEHKNLVYVLLKKGENSNDIKIRRPQTPRQPKPEVYFIRYKDQEKQGGYGAPPPQDGGYQQAPPQISAPQPVRSSYGPPQRTPPSDTYGPPQRVPSNTYGTPF